LLTEKAEVISVKKIGKNINLLRVHSPSIASSASPGQFCNIKVSETAFPLLRRPFSICNVKEESVYFMFDVHGEGTKMLCCKKKGDVLDILGPLGHGFNLETEYDAAVLVAGGIGAAPFPFLISRMNKKKKIFSLVGGRSEEHLVTYGMKNIFLSTDDGSNGLKGNVVQLADRLKDKFTGKKVEFFACGPNAMLRALKEFCLANNFECQISTESAMACGFGICQGCPIQASNEEKYYLICKDGPVFNAKDVIL
jgi:dihydroorotate dehydrogenase electron transfer subunit